MTNQHRNVSASSYVVQWKDMCLRAAAEIPVLDCCIVILIEQTAHGMKLPFWQVCCLEQHSLAQFFRFLSND